MTTTTPRVKVVHETVYTTSVRTKREAERALRDGVETLVHVHPVYPARNHQGCEFYVLDWHDEPEYDGIRQIAVIHCEPEEVPHA